VFNNGSATVNSIDEGGTPGSLGEYTFAWTDDAGTTIPGSGAGPSVNSLKAGNYLTLATNNNSNCSTTIEFEIKDMTIGTVGVNLTAFENPERCIAPKTGSLTVAATGTGAGYGFEWYNSATATGPVAGNSATLAGITVPGGLTEVPRTIVVINTSNNCRAEDHYVVPLIVNEVQGTASASPVTSCIAPDGTLFATVTNDNSVDYTYNWYIGTVVKASPDRTGKQVIGMPAGQYTMQAVDNIDAFCVTSAQVIIEDQKFKPEASATILSPVTNCDPAKANGGVTADMVNADKADYKFEWYKGAPIPVGATPFFADRSATGLDIGSYTVVATNRISGCSDDATVVIIQQLEPIPNPQIVVVSNVTSCVLDNGVLSASVNGNTSDYVFNWYIGGAVKTSIDFYGEMVDSLAVGSYTVTATSRITGCTTGPDTDQIIKEQVFPDFDFKIIPASCQGDNGFASLVMMSNVPIQTIEWNANGALVAGPNLENIGAGTYEVTVISELGCETTKDLTVGTEIRPYNGISRNGDGRNEIFNIACIENFPGNNVKIYNRAGTMVYEGDGYNNVDIYFDGKSNRGVSPMGVQLPDGTYFYVIDKRDGSKPLAGYIELVK
jgi:gliding motility-associated-like protein